MLYTINVQVQTSKSKDQLYKKKKDKEPVFQENRPPLFGGYFNDFKVFQSQFKSFNASEC